MLCSSQPNGEFTRAPTRIFVRRQSLRVGVRADGTDPYGKSEHLRGARGGPRRRRVPAAQEAVDERRSREEVGVGALAEAAAAYRPDPGHPECGAGGVWRNGSTAAGVSRWRCRCCGRMFTSPTGTVLEHCRKPLPIWISFIRLMRRIVPVECAAEEGEPRAIGLGVHRVDAQDAPPAARVAADGRHHGGGGHAPLSAALHVGRVEPDVGHRGAAERPSAKLLDVGVQARGDGAHLVL